LRRGKMGGSVLWREKTKSWQTRGKVLFLLGGTVFYSRAQKTWKGRIIFKNEKGKKEHVHLYWGGKGGFIRGNSIIKGVVALVREFRRKGPVMGNRSWQGVLMAPGIQISISWYTLVGQEKKDSGMTKKYL